MDYGFHQKEQDLNTNGGNCSFIICIRKSRHNSPLNYFINNLANAISKQKLLQQK